MSFLEMNERRFKIVLVVFGLIGVGCILYGAWLSEVEEAAKARDVIFINNEIKELQKDILSLKRQLQKTDVLLEAIMQGRDGFYVRLESLGELEDFWREKNEADEKEFKARNE